MSPFAKSIETAMSKYPKDLTAIYEADQKTLVTLCGQDEKGMYGQINGKKTHLLGPEKLKEFKKNVYNQKIISLIVVAATVNFVIATTLFAVLLVLGLALATLTLYMASRYFTHQKIITEQTCLTIQLLVGSGQILNFTPLHSQDEIPVFKYIPTLEARKHYGPMTALMLSDKTNPQIEHYIDSHRKQLSHTLPFALLTPVVPSS